MQLNRFFFLPVLTNKKARWFFLTYFSLSFALFIWVTWTLMRLTPQLSEGADLKTTPLEWIVLSPYVRFAFTSFFVVLGTGVSVRAMGALPRLQTWIDYLYRGGTPVPFRIRANDTFEAVATSLNALLVDRPAQLKKVQKQPAVSTPLSPTNS